MSRLVAVAILLFTGLIAVAKENVYRIDSSITPPVIVKRVEADFSHFEKKVIATGALAIFECVIDQKGNVKTVRILKSEHPADIDAVFISAIKQWKYKPALKEGKPVSVYLTVTGELVLK